MGSIGTQHWNMTLIYRYIRVILPPNIDKAEWQLIINCVKGFIGPKHWNMFLIYRYHKSHNE